MAMVRKQIYIEQRQDEKLKRLALSSNVPEAEIIRRAIEGLVEYQAGHTSSSPRVREVAILTYGAQEMKEHERVLNLDRRNRRLDHLAWQEELAFIESRAKNLAEERSERTWTRDDLYDRRRLRLPD